MEKAALKSSKPFLLVALLIMLCVVQFVDASPGLDITLTIDRSPPIYYLGEFVDVQGDLTWDGSPVPDGLVALQIDDPDKGYFILRTLSTGTPPDEGGVVEILEVIPCDSQGNPQQIFTRDDYAHFSVTLQNNDEDPMYVLMCVNIFDAKMAPLHASIQHAGLMEPGEFSLLFPCMIPEEAALGNATIHVSAFNALPRNQGAQAYPYCPEKSAVFTIESPVRAAPSTSYPVGTYGLTFKLPWTGKLGSYETYATSNYEGEWVYSSINFNVKLPETPSPPEAFFTAPARASVNKTIHFDGSGSSAEGYNDSIVSYEWNFDDGTPPVFGQEIDHSFTQEGTYTVTLHVTDSENLWNTTSNPIDIVLYFSPTADFTWSPLEPRTNNNVTFDASASYDEDGIVVSYFWDFGDGSNKEVTSAFVDHVYIAEGNYSVTLTITDSQGLQDNKIKTITVRAEPLLYGDVNEDGIVDIYDAILLALAFGSTPGEPAWNWRCDFNGDLIVDIYDAIKLGVNFGKTV
jgi:PKD repeat protein